MERLSISKQGTKLKIGIFTNFAVPFHTGGSERVVQQIAESMVNDYAAEVFVYPQYGRQKIVHNKVTILPVGNLTDDIFVNVIRKENLDHIFIYSDWYFKFEALLKNIDVLNTKYTLIPIGFNRIQSNATQNKIIKELFFAKRNKINIVLHSADYSDAKFCNRNKIDFDVIHNGIDLNEFSNNFLGKFRSKYNIQNQYLLLYVGNFFPGKGHNNILQIIDELRSHNLDFVFCCISSSTNFVFEKNLHANFITKVKEKNLPVIDLRNINRQEIISAFHDADFFVSASEKEVAPLVILESMAAKTPWISMDVGNVKDLHGGIVLKVDEDVDGNKIFTKETASLYASNIIKILQTDKNRSDLENLGYKQVFETYNWDKIKLKYKDLFYGKSINSNDGI